MFFLKELTHEVLLHPKYFGPDLRKHLLAKLYQEKEGTFDGRTGHVLCIVEVTRVTPGKINDGTGFARFILRYKAIVCRLFKNEVVDAVVTDVNQFGCMAKVGPVEVFVSRQLMPDDYTFVPTAVPPRIESPDPSIYVGKDQEIRMRIISTNVSAMGVTVVGSIKEDYLGMFYYHARRNLTEYR